MARRESKALAGFFPAPTHLIEVVADLLRPDVPEHKAGRSVVVDPCAGEGVALKSLSEHLEIRPGYKSVDTYACEMERTRWEALRQIDPMCQHGYTEGQHLHGDFFHVRFSPGMADVLLLNPPYDQDRDFKRLEARWIHHCAPILAQGGILVFIVPHYALAACADVMAFHFTDLRAYRFPGKDFDTFKQVFVLGRKVERAAPEPSVAAWCRALANDATTAAELPMDGSGEHYPVRYRSTSGDTLGIRVDRTTWTMTHFDVSGVAAMAPWASERGAMPDLDHPADLCHRLGAVYPVVNPPRPVHLAAALAAGVFNGLPANPNPGRSLPALLVKGTFRRRWETVDQRHDKDGALTGEVQIEKPELEVWALDLRAAEYHQLRSSAETTGAADVASMTFADLLEAYSVDLLAALRSACPVLHDPGRDDEPSVEGLGRPLWPPQTSTVHALDKLTRQPGRGALVIGEVGTGKTSIALALAQLRGVARSLVICPPHLLTSWENQVRIVRPDADVVVLESISDVIGLRSHPGPVVAVLSREAAKLGHGWRDLGSALGRTGQTCPACGSKVEGDRLAEKRTRCQGHTLATRTALGRWVLRHRHLLVRCDPENVSLHKLVEPTIQGERFLAWAKKHPATDELHERLTVALAELYALLYRDEQGRNKVLHAVAWARPSTAAHGLGVIPGYNRAQDKHLGYMEIRQRIALACDTRPDLGAHPDESEGRPYGHGIPGMYGAKSAAECWKSFNESWDFVHGIWEAKPDPRGWTASQPAGFRFGSGHDDTGPGYGRETLRNHKRGSTEALSYALTRIMLCAGVRLRGCGEPLFQAVPEPRRYPIGTYITRYAQDVFQAVIIDEAHEMASEQSAQGIVSTRLAQMANKTGALLLYMTGSLVNGYAESAFHALRAVSPKFRAEFGHKDRERFVDQYGLRKRVLVYDAKDKRAASRGAHSERVLTGAKKAGQAPGVLPVLLLDHLLGSAAIIHKADLEIGLPAQSEQTALIEMTPEQEANLNSLIETLKEAIRQTRFIAGCAGKLFGAFCHLMAYPDLAACEDYEVSWPDNVAVTRTRSFDVAPGVLVARVPRLDPTVLLPKEAWMLATVQEELGQDRGCMVLPAQVQLLERLAWILDQAGIEPVVLRSEKVPPSKREAWIDRHLNRKSRRVLVTNPTCVQTGLNNLVSLATSVWYSNPDCKPIVYRQANGRIHRPGQVLPVRSLFPLYNHKLPVAGHKLLLHKVGVSLAVDGLDPDAVLEAAGVASEFTAGLNVGQQLYRMLVDEAGG